jgi:hypothetical protein
MGWIVSFLRYAAARLFWTLRGLGRHDVLKKYRGGLKALKALRRTASPRCPHATVTLGSRKLT